MLSYHRQKGDSPLRKTIIALREQWEKKRGRISTIVGPPSTQTSLFDYRSITENNFDEEEGLFENKNELPAPSLNMGGISTEENLFDASTSLLELGRGTCTSTMPKIHLRCK